MGGKRIWDAAGAAGGVGRVGGKVQAAGAVNLQVPARGDVLLVRRQSSHSALRARGRAGRGLGSEDKDLEGVIRLGNEGREGEECARINIQIEP